MYRDLSFLARHCFDFCPESFAARRVADRRRIRGLYPDPFRHMMEPALVPGERTDADRRVRSALHLEEPP
jgi:hypothetical protein